jgi:hypothetical protein
MKFIPIAITALMLAFAVPAVGQPLPTQKVPIFTGVVCDTATDAERYIDLVNSAVSYDEVWRLTNAGHKDPVCGILKIAYYPEPEMPVLRLLRGEAVDIVAVMMYGEEVAGMPHWMVPGVRQYLIMTRKTDGA